MADAPVTVNRFSWPDLMPAMVIFRALPTALGMTVLILALFAVAATPIGWIGMEMLLFDSTVETDEAFAKVIETNRSPWKNVYPNWSSEGSVLTVLGNQVRGVELIFKTAIGSFQGIFSLEQNLGKFLYYFGGALWTIIVWSFFGCAITRTALMRYTREEPVGLDDAFDFAWDKFFSCFGGIVIPLLAVFGLSIPIALIGLLMSTNFGVVVGGALWFVVLILSLVISLILLGLMFAWPLIVSAVACEGQDSFDGMSRAFAYVFQRPIHYLIYAVIALIFSGVCWLVASNVIEGSIRMGAWASSWGMNVSEKYRSLELSDSAEFKKPAGDEIDSLNDVIDATQREAVSGRKIAQPREDEESDLVSQQEAATGEKSGSDSVQLAKKMISFWNIVARTLGAAFLFAMFWSVAAAMYLLLRKDLDATEMDDIFLVDERRTYELPPLKDDPSGIPQVDEDAILPASIDPPDEPPPPPGDSSPEN